MAPQQQSKQQVQLKELGAKLESPPSSKDSLLKLLKQGAGILAEVDQSPPEPILESMQPFLKAVVKPELLKHQDKDVRLLVASCLCEITRITAPEAPYSDEILKDIFTLVVGTFSGLSDTSGPSFGRRVIILQTLARYRSCVMMLDLECDDLVREMFRTCIGVVRDDHPESVLSSMKTIMVVLIEESEEITEDLLLILLSTLGQNRKDTPKAARKLVMDVIENCTVKLEPVVKQFLISSMSDDSGSSKVQIDYHDVIYDLYCCSPSILSGVVPYITGELLTDKLETRLKSVNLAGQLFSLPGSSVSKEFEQIFSEFLKRLTDRVVEVRMAVLGHIKNSALHDRILDYDENVRRQVVEVVCDVARSDLDSVPVDTTKLVAERLRDKSLVVKKYTMDKLADIYSQYCLRSSGGSSLKYDWIPGKILRCFYDKDFRSDAIEAILSGPLFPSEFTVQDLVNQWVMIFSGLDKVEAKAMEKILEQKQRLQQEMLRYLSLKQSHKDGDVSDLQRKTITLFRAMSRCFTDAAKAEEGFQGVDQLKDSNIWKILSNLLDPNTTFSEGRSHRDDLLKILGEKHPLLDFLTILSMKCSYILFNKEHVKEILSAIKKGAEASTENILSSMNVLVILARYSPLLLIGNEQDLLHLLKDDNEVIKEGILHVFARAGGTIRQQLASSSVDIILERLCLEGSRRQAKYAVHALAAITKDDGLLSLSVLYKRLVDMLDNKTHLPAVLQSLGCIAQTAMAVFETRENEIVEFIKNKILESRNKAKSKKKRWLDRSELCLLKIYGIKTLVKSYLPVKDVHLRGGIDDLINILRNMLQFGVISKEIETSSVDKAHLKLAAAKAVLRLSRCWDHKIPADVFHLTLRTVEINYPQARKLFLGKVHQYVKDRVLDAKYACAFLIDIVGSKRGQHDVDEHNLADIIQMCRQLRLRQLSVPSDTNSILYPEGMLPYLIHALAHHPACPAVDECKDAKAYESIYRVLHLFLAMVVLGEEDTKANPTDQEKEILSTIISIFQRIRLSEDVVDTTKSRNSHAICELGLSITKRLGEDLEGQQVAVAAVALPLMLFKPRENNGEDDAEVGEVLPWLAEDSATAHFESLKLKVNGMVHPEIVHDEIFEDSGRDGEEMPLGKLIKHIKSQKNKKKTVEKNGSTPGEIQNVVEDDILKVAMQITLDSVDASVEMESNNGHDIHSSSKKDDSDNKKQKRKAQDEASVPVPKRQRSASARSPSKFSFLKSVLKSPAHSESKGSDSGKDGREPEGADTSGQKSPKSPLKSQKIECADVKPSVGSSNKKKRKSVAGLAKCTSNGGNPGADLVDRRILVCWPLDKKFYGGVVKSYDPEKNKHVVLYDDLDVEVLCLDKERWELVDEGHTPNKTRQKVGKNPQKEGSQDEENERSDGSRKKKSDKKSATKKKQASAAALGDKSTSKKSVTAVKATLLSEGDNGSDFSRPTTSELDEPLSDDSKTEPEDYANKSESGYVNEPSEAEKVEDKPEVQSPKDFDEETKPSPEIDQTEATDGGAQDIPVSDVSESSPDEKASEAILQDSNEVIPAKADNGSSEPSQPKLLESVDAEDADDKPLISWKRRVVKAKEIR
ncbi:Sister chromatid cohesion protein PDS5 homolog A-like protein [Drosera capensis]